MSLNPAVLTSAIATVLLLPLSPAIAQDAPSTSATDLPILSNDVQGEQYLQDGVEQELIFRRALEQSQAAGAEQFGDVTPEEWAYQALDDLVRRYDCLKGYPNGTYRGDRTLTRYELAAALNSCLQSVERLLANVTEDNIRQEQWEAIQALQQEFSASFTALKDRIDALESRIAALESYQFSTTTKFSGEVIFAFSDLAIDGTARFLPRGTINGVTATGLTDNDDHHPVFGARGRFWLRSSFSGEDILLIRATSSNLAMFDDANELTGRTVSGTDIITGETTQTFNIGANTATFETNNFTVAYSFPLNDDVHTHIFANGGLWSDFVPTLNPYFEDYDGGNGALSTFASSNPIYRIGGGAGVGFNVDLDFMNLAVGYLSGPQSTKNPGGVFSGDYAMLLQSTFEVSDNFHVGLTYNHGYHPSGTAVFDMGGLGSQGVVGSAIANGASSGSTTPKITNAYGIELAWQPSDAIALSSFFTYVDAHVPAVQSGNYEVWTYGFGAAFPDLLKEGGILGIFAGTQPYMAGFDGQDLSIRNKVLPRHLELFYRYPVSDYLSITPGIIFLTSPNQIKAGGSIFTLRATFSF